MNQNEAADNKTSLINENTIEDIIDDDLHARANDACNRVEFSLGATSIDDDNELLVENLTHDDTISEQQNSLASENAAAMKQFPVSNADTTITTTTMANTINVACCSSDNELQTLQINNSLSLIATTNATTHGTATITAATATDSQSQSAIIPSSLTTSVSSMPHLNHAASAPTFGSNAAIQLRPTTNQQQQQKIKSYHDAKQTALWDTTGSTATGTGTILKTSLNNLYCTPRLLRKSSESSNLGSLPRRVSFPKSDSELVTGYLEPANPWEHVTSVNSINEIVDLYTKSCHKHNTKPLTEILEHLKAVELNKLLRQPALTLKNTQLLPGDCEALEEVLKRVQYKTIDLSSCELEESALSALCDIIEYYEAANELNISSNPKGMTTRGWSSCANMVGRSQALQILNAEGNPISKSSAECLGNALCTSNLHTVKLEHCGLKGPPLTGLCLKIRHNRNLKELWLAHNDLDSQDAENIAELLRYNHFLEFVDISNNNIGDIGLKHIVVALIIQTKELERRSMFQRAAAIESDDIFSPVESSTVDDETLFANVLNSDHEMMTTNSSSSKEAEKDSSNLKSTTAAATAVATSLLIPCLEDLTIESETIAAAPTIFVDNNETEDDNEETIKSSHTNTIINNKNKSFAAVAAAAATATASGAGGGGGGGGQSMLDKLLSMNSDSSSEENGSNLSTDTIAACGSEDASFISDDIFEMAQTKLSTKTAASGPINVLLAEADSLQLCAEIMQHDNELQTHKMSRQQNILCDTCTLEAKNHCICRGGNIVNVNDDDAAAKTKTNDSQIIDFPTTNNENNRNNNINTNNNNNNNNNNNHISNIKVQRDAISHQQHQHQRHHQNAYKNDQEKTEKFDQLAKNFQTNSAAAVDNELPQSALDVSAFKVTKTTSTPTPTAVADGSVDFLVPCSSQTKPPNIIIMRSTSAMDASTPAVDVNKNSSRPLTTTINDDYDDTHSTDSAFESASEGDISRHLSEEFTRLSNSLESSRLDDIASKELIAIETATIATESTESLTEATLMAGGASVMMSSNVGAAATTATLAKIGTQKSDEVKTKENAEVRFAEPLHVPCMTSPSLSTAATATATSTAHSNQASSRAVSPTNSSINCESSLLPTITTANEESSPIPTPPPPATSPGGAGLSMRRTDSSCNFVTQSTRNHSHSSDSLCSDNSLDGSVSSDLNLSSSASASAAASTAAAVTNNERFTKNDTLTRQLRNFDQTRTSETNATRSPAGLKALAVWNNNLTKDSGLYIADLLGDTTSLELLNIGKNILSNEFVFRIKESLSKNTTLTTLGLQSAHLSAGGIEALAAILSFGGNSTLQRIDIRDNKLEAESLNTLAEALKSNTTVTQIDIDDEPKRISVGSDAHLQYMRVVENVRSMCSRNEKTQAQLLAAAEKTANASGGAGAGGGAAGGSKRRSGYYVGSRKISLTCHSRPLIECCSVAPAVAMAASAANKLEVKRKTGVRLRSPVPSPPTISPSSSPSRSRFQVCRVTESSPLTSPLAQMPPPTSVAISVVNSSSSIPISLSSSHHQHQQHQHQQNLTASHSLPSMATATSSTQTIKRPASASRSSRFHVSKIYEDPKVPMAKRSLPPITPPIHLPPSPMLKATPKNQVDEDDDDVFKAAGNLTFKESNVTNSSNDSTLTADIVAEQRIQNVRCPIAVFNENDITLTHDAGNEMISTAAAATAASDASEKVKANCPVNSQHTENDGNDDNVNSNSNNNNSDSSEPFASDINLTPNIDAQHQNARKLSCPTAVDKLLTLFNPVAIFQRSSSPEPPKHFATLTSIEALNSTSSTAQTTTTTTATTTTATTTTLPNTIVKPTPPPSWSKLGTDILNITVGENEKNFPIERESRSFLDAASKQLRDLGKQVFRQSPPQPQQQQQEPQKITNISELDKKFSIIGEGDGDADGGATDVTTVTEIPAADAINVAINVTELILPPTPNDSLKSSTAADSTFDDSTNHGAAVHAHAKVIQSSASTLTDSSDNF